MNKAIQELLAKAVREHQAGRLDAARRLYLEILAIDVRHAKSLYGLGLIALAAGGYEAAARMFERAIAAGGGGEAAHHANLGAALLGQNKRDEALAAYQRALALQPEYEEAHFSAALILLELGRLDEARPHLDRSLALRPGSAETHQALARLLARQGRAEEAIATYRRALALRPESTDALNNLGNLLCTIGDLAGAKSCFERVIVLEPDRAEAHNNLGVAFRDQGMFDEAEACHKRALELQPDYADAYNNLGIVYRDTGRLEESAACHERALAIRPGYPEAFNNLGNTRRSQARLEEAQACYDKALALSPADAEARFNRSLVELLRGDFAAGWRDYEARYERLRNAPRCFPQPLWRGEPLDGARILLHAEQGLGDTIQFLRYVPMVRAGGGRVILDVPQSLMRLAAELPGVECLVVPGDPPPEFEWQCPLMGLPLAFGTNLESIPAGVPYLSVPGEAQQNADALPWPDDGLRAGLVWSGNPKYPDDRQRSIPLEWLAPLFGVESVRFFSLQLGPAAEQLTGVEAPVTDLRTAITDMADTAELIAKLDLVITVDTAVAHLAGALARRTWLLLPFAPDWRWLTDREDSPWYPTMRLFRQARFGEWPPVIERVRDELAMLAGSGRREARP